MSCICRQPVRPEFKSSYKDLLDKPRINGVPLDGDVNTDNLHIEYPHLANLPQINGVPVTGNLTSTDLGIKAGAQFKIVQQLPITDIDEATVYLIPVQVGQTDNIYQEYIYINNKWEKIGEPISMEGGSGVESLNKIVDAAYLISGPDQEILMDGIMRKLGLKNNHIYLSQFNPSNPTDSSLALRFAHSNNVPFINIRSITSAPNDMIYSFFADDIDVVFFGEIYCCNNILYYRGKFVSGNDIEHIYVIVP